MTSQPMSPIAKETRNAEEALTAAQDQVEAARIAKGVAPPDEGLAADQALAAAEQALVDAQARNTEAWRRARVYAEEARKRADVRRAHAAELGMSFPEYVGVSNEAARAGMSLNDYLATTTKEGRRRKKEIARNKEIENRKNEPPRRAGWPRARTVKLTPAEANGVAAEMIDLHPKSKAEGLEQFLGRQRKLPVVAPPPVAVPTPTGEVSKLVATINTAEQQKLYKEFKAQYGKRPARQLPEGYTSYGFEGMVKGPDGKSYGRPHATPVEKIPGYNESNIAQTEYDTKLREFVDKKPTTGFATPTTTPTEELDDIKPWTEEDSKKRISEQNVDGADMQKLMKAVKGLEQLDPVLHQKLIDSGAMKPDGTLTDIATQKMRQARILGIDWDRPRPPLQPGNRRPDGTYVPQGAPEEPWKKQVFTVDKSMFTAGVLSPTEGVVPPTIQEHNKIGNDRYVIDKKRQTMEGAFNPRLLPPVIVVPVFFHIEL